MKMATWATLVNAKAMMSFDAHKHFGAFASAPFQCK
jgi:hypothetical protein